MEGFPIRYVAREVSDGDKVVAYFVSPVYLFEETKRYNSDGSCIYRYEVDFIKQVYDEKFKIENSPALKRFYKNKTFLGYPECKMYVNLLNNKILYDSIQNCTQEQFKKVTDKYRRYFNYAEQLGNKLQAEVNKSENNIIK